MSSVCCAKIQPLILTLTLITNGRLQSRVTHTYSNERLIPQLGHSYREPASQDLRVCVMFVKITNTIFGHVDRRMHQFKQSIRALNSSFYVCFEF